VIKPRIAMYTPTGTRLPLAATSRTAPLAAEAEPLAEAQRDEQQWRQDADLLVGWQHTDQERCAAHDNQRQVQHGLSTARVAEMAEHDRAKRSTHIGDSQRRQRGKRAQRRAQLWKEQPIEDQRRRRAVQEEVVILDGRADETRHGNPPQ
jgi:hypothetical protein